MDVKCPHCKKHIALVGTKELRSEFGLTGNQIQHARDHDQMPDPWLQLENRYLYLQMDIADYVGKRSRAKVQSAVQEIMAAIASLPEAERDEATKVLESELGGAKRRR